MRSLSALMVRVRFSATRGRATLRVCARRPAPRVRIRRSEPFKDWSSIRSVWCITAEHKRVQRAAGTRLKWRAAGRAWDGHREAVDVIAFMGPNNGSVIAILTARAMHGDSRATPGRATAGNRHNPPFSGNY